MTQERKIKALIRVLSTKNTAYGVLSTIARGEKIGIDISTILIHSNRRLFELKRGKYKSYFKLG